MLLICRRCSVMNDFMKFDRSVSCTQMCCLCLCIEYRPYGPILFRYTIKLFYLRCYDPNRKLLNTNPLFFFATNFLFAHFICSFQIPSKLATPFSFSVNEHFHFGVCSVGWWGYRSHSYVDIITLSIICW